MSWPGERPASGVDEAACATKSPSVNCGVSNQNMMQVRCPACKTLGPLDLGPLPEMPPTFGGQPFPAHPPPGNLWHCLSCQLRFRFPYLSQAELTGLYHSLPDGVWAFPDDRHTWKTVRTLCDSYSPGRNILDIGCFGGEFLARMPPGWERFGIEPSCSARAIATSRGIEIIGNSLELTPDQSSLRRHHDVRCH